MAYHLDILVHGLSVHPSGGQQEREVEDHTECHDRFRREWSLAWGVMEFRDLGMHQRTVPRAHQQGLQYEAGRRFRQGHLLFVRVPCMGSVARVFPMPCQFFPGWVSPGPS